MAEMVETMERKWMKTKQEEGNNQVVGGGGGSVTAAHLRKFGRIRGLAFGSFGEWSEDVDDLVRMCTRQSAKNSWMDAGFRNQAEARAIFTQHIFKK